MKENTWIERLFKTIDSKDSKTFMTFLAPSCVFRFGNMPAVEGNGDIAATIDAFFGSIDSLVHELYDIWEIPGGIVCHGQVSYTRKDGTVLTVPFANVLKGPEQDITEYLIFADTSSLYEY